MFGFLNKLFKSIFRPKSSTPPASAGSSRGNSAGQTRGQGSGISAGAGIAQTGRASGGGSAGTTRGQAGRTSSASRSASAGSSGQVEGSSSSSGTFSPRDATSGRDSRSNSSSVPNQNGRSKGKDSDRGVGKASRGNGNAMPVREQPAVPGIYTEQQSTPSATSGGSTNTVVIVRSENKELSEGEEQQVDYLLAIEDDPLAKDMLLRIKQEGIPQDIMFADYMKQFAQWGWDDLSDEHAKAIMEIVMQDRANDQIESLVVFDEETGFILIDRIGIEGPEEQQWVGLQVEEIEAMRGRDIIFVHNHPASVEASDEDLQVAWEAEAESVIILTPEGYEYVYIRGESGMEFVGKNDLPFEVAPPTVEEYLQLKKLSRLQFYNNLLDYPEYLLRQDISPEIKIQEFKTFYNIASEDPNAKEILLSLANLYVDDESIELQAMAKLVLLEYQYNVKLSVSSVNPGNDFWSAQGIINVFEAVSDVANALWFLEDELAPYAKPQNQAELFQAIVGPLDIRLSDEQKSFYGITYAYDPERIRDESYNVITFFKDDWEKSAWFKFNLVHEIGHVINNRVAGFAANQVDRFNQQYSGDPRFRTLGWGEASGDDWIEKMNVLRDSPIPQVTRQFDPTQTDSVYQIYEDWADMFLFWVYDERSGQTTFSHPNSGRVVIGGITLQQSAGEIRQDFMESYLPIIMDSRYRIRLTPEELAASVGWITEGTILPKGHALENLEYVVEMRKDLQDVENLDATDINEDHSIVAGALYPGEVTTILGQSRNHPNMILTIAKDGEIGWSLITLVDLTGMDITSLPQLDDDAIEQLFGLRG